MSPPGGRIYLGGELLGIAKRFELAMESYYRELAKEYPAKKELFSAFADEEAEHAVIASALLENVEECSEEEKTRLSEVMGIFERSEYLPNSMDAMGRIKAPKSVDEAMRLSSELERRIELFYCQIAPSFEPTVRKRLYDLIISEHKHRIQVEEMTEITTSRGAE